MGSTLSTSSTEHALIDSAITDLNIKTNNLLFEFSFSDMVWGAWNDCDMVKVKMANLIVIIKRYLKIPFSLNFLCGNAVPMRSRPTTPLHFYIKMVSFCIQSAIKNIHQIKFVTSIQIFLCELNTPQQA